jgi:uncharacterized membrane protein
MSQLVVIAYPDEATAQQALGTLKRLSTEQLINLEDAAYVTRDLDGKPKLHQTQSLVGAGAAGGAFWGFLFGLIFLVPVAGLAFGALGGALGGKMTDLGIDDKFMKDLGEQIKPGTAALFLLVRSSVADRVVPEMAKLGGTVLRTSLSTEQENQLKEALGHPTPAEAGV